MKVLRKYAAQHGFNYSNLLKDFNDSSEEEQAQFLMQIGGEVPQQSTQDPVGELIQVFAQISGKNPEELIAQLQQMPEEEQQRMLEQMAQAVQQAGGEEKEILQKGGIPVTAQGYYELDPKENPYALIPSGDITMEGIDFPINAYDGHSGQFLQEMQPGEEYQFDTDMVLEEPIYGQVGLSVKNVDKKYVYLSDGQKLTQAQFKSQYLDRMRELNMTKYDTDERRTTSSLIKQYKSFQPKEEVPAKKVVQGKVITPLNKNNFSSNAEPIRVLRKEGNTFILNTGQKIDKDEFQKQFKPSTKFSSGYELKTNSSSNTNTEKPKSKFEEWFFSGIEPYRNKSNPVKLPEIKSEITSTAVNPEQGVVTVKSNNASKVFKGSKYMPPSTNKNDWASVWEKFLVGQNVLDGDHNYSTDEIDDSVEAYVKQNPEIYKNNKYINQSDFPSLLKDGIYGKVHESVLPPNLPEAQERINIAGLTPLKSRGQANIPVRFTQNPLNPANLPNLDAKIDDEKVQSSKGKSPQYKFAANNFLQNVLTGNNLAKAFQPTAPIFRRQANILAEELPEIDYTPAFQQLADQFRLAQKNINPNSTVGAAINADFYAQTLDKMVELSNNAAQQNQQIKAKNLFNKVNAVNQQYQQQEAFDQEAYENFLATSANSDMIKQQALGEAARVYQGQKQDRLMLDMLPMMNPQLEESSTPFDRLTGKRVFQQNPEFIKIYLQKLAEDNTKEKSQKK